MAPVIPDPKKIRAFRNAAAFEAWLETHHGRADELWLRIFKKATGTATVTYAEALDVALCWGWIDGLRKSYDAESFIQRFTPRRPKSVWSQVNRGHVDRLIRVGKMRPSGLAQVEAAKADGRWAAAYAPIRSASHDTMPPDLLAAIQKNPKAKAAFERLGRVNLFAIIYRTNAMKTPAGRAKKIASIVSMLAAGKVIVPASGSGTA